jgi:hypothetical protein
VSSFARAIALFLVCLSSGAAAGSLAQECPPQPLPDAADVLPEVPAVRVVTFAATPMMAVPGRAWVVRIQSGGSAGLVEIARLRRQMDCNRYDVEARWQAPLPARELAALVRAAASIGTPPADVFVHDDQRRMADELVLDGTGITLDLEVTGWRVRRELNHSGRAGAEVSKLFRDVVLRHVPPSEVPAEDWR